MLYPAHAAVATMKKICILKVVGAITYYNKVKFHTHQFSDNNTHTFYNIFKNNFALLLKSKF